VVLALQLIGQFHKVSHHQNFTDRYLAKPRPEIFRRRDFYSAFTPAILRVLGLQDGRLMIFCIMGLTFKAQKGNYSWNIPLLRYCYLIQ
jgi:hypothetical protein